MRRKEDVSFRREPSALTAETVLDAVAREFGMEAATLRKRPYDCVARAVTALLLGRYAGRNQRAAACLGMGTGNTACRQLQRLRARLADEPVLAERVKRIDLALEGRPSPSDGVAISMIKG